MRAAGFVVAVISTVACFDGGAVPTESERSTAERLAQVWEVSLEKAARPHDKGAGAERAGGQIAFVLNANYMNGPSRDPSNYGSYDIDFSRLGFNLENAPIPIASAWSLPGDSVEIILGPSNAASVVIRASVTENMLRGRWYLRLPRGAGESGMVTATPHDQTQR